MNQQPDKFFRDKLEGYRPVVSSEAWTQVAANLAGKSNHRSWLKLAAALLLLTAAGILIFAFEKNNPALMASEESPAKRKDAPVEHQRDTPEQKLPAEKPGTAAVPAVAEANPEKKISQRSTSAASTVRKPVMGDDHKGKKQHAAQPEAVEARSPVDDKAVAIHQATATAKNVTLVFSAQEVNEKYLKKKNSVAEATTEAKEASTWRKLLDKANDLKHNQDPLGGLRQKKNEILALNFKNDNQSHENQ